MFQVKLLKEAGLEVSTEEFQTEKSEVDEALLRIKAKKF
jgi:hypothetical protein